MQDTRLKVYVDPDGIERIAVATRGLGKSRVVVCAMHDELPALTFDITIDEWNALPHHTFRDLGPAPKTDYKFRGETP